MNAPRRQATGILLALCFGLSQAVCACPSLGSADTSGHVHPATSHDAPAGDPLPFTGHGHETCGHCDLPRLGSDPGTTGDTGPLPAPPQFAALPGRYPDETQTPGLVLRTSHHRRTILPPDTPVSRRDRLLD